METTESSTTAPRSATLPIPSEKVVFVEQVPEQAMTRGGIALPARTVQRPLPCGLVVAAGEATHRAVGDLVYFFEGTSHPLVPIDADGYRIERKYWVVIGESIMGHEVLDEQKTDQLRALIDEQYAKDDSGA